jgi:two-component system sensor histidine kinase RcsD
MQIDIATDISTTGMQLLWTVPMSTMLLESLQNILLPLLLNIGLLALALFGFTTFRHYKGRSHVWRRAPLRRQQRTASTARH